MGSLIIEFKNICREIGLKPARSRGQNFLINKDIYEKIIKYSLINRGDIILEVGPGLGYLTNKLAKVANKVLAIEIEDSLVGYLQKKFIKEKVTNIKVLKQDIRRFSIDQELAGSKYKVVANLPYNISSFFIKKFLSAKNKPFSMTLLLQKEVAERIIAKPSKMSMLSVATQYFAHVKAPFFVARNNFWPSPNVDSAIVVLQLKKQLPLNRDKEKAFFNFVKAGFAARRKMLKNNLSARYRIDPALAQEIVTESNFSASIRAQDLGIEDWLNLFGCFNKKCYNIIK